jgi:hypothetical protein
LYIMMGWKQICIDQFHRFHDTMEEIPRKTICLVHRGRLKTTARDSWLGLKSAFLASCWQKLIDCSNRSAGLLWHCVFVTAIDTSTLCNSSCVSWSFTWQCLQQIYIKLSTDPWYHGTVNGFAEIANTCVHSAGLKAILRDSQHQLKCGSTTNCLQESCTAATECSTMTFYVW